MNYREVLLQEKGEKTTAFENTSDLTTAVFHVAPSTESHLCAVVKHPEP